MKDSRNLKTISYTQRHKAAASSFCCFVDRCSQSRDWLIPAYFLSFFPNYSSKIDFICWIIPAVDDADALLVCCDVTTRNGLLHTSVFQRDGTVRVSLLPASISRIPGVSVSHKVTQAVTDRDICHSSPAFCLRVADSGQQMENSDATFFFPLLLRHPLIL